MNQELLHDWLAFLAAPRCGYRLYDKLISRIGSLEGLGKHSPAGLRSLGLAPDQIEAIRNPDPAKVAAILSWLDQDHHHLITVDNVDYPPLLLDISSPPLALYVAGDPTVLWNPQLAMVGSRNPSEGGRHTAASFAGHLAAEGQTITSGLAFGIDSAAHRAALDARGQTVAVLGNGAGSCYPPAHTELAGEIARRGAVVTEYPPGTPIRRGNFPARNRIISGLSLGCLVVEASLKSGSLLTAKSSTEQGREVFAIPGSIHNPMSRGCHYLIKNGAKLIETADEVVVELQPMANRLATKIRARIGQDNAKEAEPYVEVKEKAPIVEGDEDYRQLLDRMSYDPVSIDELVQRTGLTANAVSSMLLILELDGKISAEPGGVYCLHHEVA